MVSAYCGVSFLKRLGKWQAGIMIQGKRKHLGTFHSDEEAARKYDETAALHGKPMNFPLLEGQEQAVKPMARGSRKGKKQEVQLPQVFQFPHESQVSQVVHVTLVPQESQVKGTVKVQTTCPVATASHDAVLSALDMDIKDLNHSKSQVLDVPLAAAPPVSIPMDLTTGARN